jgi:hypothetical protein
MISRGTELQILAGQAASPGDRGSDADSTFEASQGFCAVRIFLFRPGA